MLTRKKCLLGASLVISCLAAYGQKADSLNTVLDTARGPSRVKTFNELFRAYVNTDPVKAVGYARQAMDLATEINDTRGTAASLNNLGVAYKNQGALDQALAYYMHSLELYQGLKNDEGVATTKNNIATIYSLKKDYGQAMRYLEESHDELVKLDNKQRLVGSMNNLGILYSNLQLYEKAMKNFSGSFQLSQDLGHPFADPLSNVGNIYFRQGNYQRAIEYYDRALALEQHNNNSMGVLNDLTNIGIAYTQAHQAAKGQQYLGQAESMARQLNAHTMMPQIFKSKADSYYQQGDLKEAYLTMVRYDSAREEVFGEESSRRIAQLEMAISLHEKEKEYDMLQKEDQIKSLQLRNSRMFVVMFIILLFGIIALLNFYFVSRKKKMLSELK
jgi:tetratricopeptide (TPR) repeat protein